MFFPRPRGYMGRPENFDPNFNRNKKPPTKKDDKAEDKAKEDKDENKSLNAKQPTPSGPKGKPKPPANMPGPRHAPGNPGPTKDEPVWKDAIFGVDMTVKENNLRVNFMPSAVGLIPTANEVYKQITTDDPNFGKTLTVEGFRYYATGLIWQRVVDLKLKTSVELTPLERRFQDMNAHISWNIPEPLVLYLHGMGKIITKIDQHLYPVFPNMPDAVIGGFGGYFGDLGINNQIHNLYEEWPALGVVAEGVMHAVSDDPTGFRYASRLDRADRLVNNNLQGYDILSYRRPEAKNSYLNVGVTPVEFPDSLVQSGYCQALMMEISDIISRTKTFRVQNITIPSLAENGSQAQIVAQRPDLNDQGVETKCVNGPIKCESLARESTATYGVGTMFDFQLYKEENPTPGVIVNDAIKSWCCINFEGDVHDLERDAWILNRNMRRNLPMHYLSPVFSTITQMARDIRQKVVLF